MAYQVKTDELDFDLIKSNLKAFFQSQGVFTDYDYEGSTLSALMDVLAYNTMYQAHYNHMTINEMFLDSASKLSSVISLAKAIGYTPRSTKSSRSSANITVTGVLENPTVLTLPAGTEFKATLGDVDYSFYTLTDYTAQNASGVFLFNSVDLVEGTRLSKSYVVSPGSKFVIPNKEVDVTTISVTVQESSVSTVFDKFSLADDIVTVTATDKVFFVKQREDLLYEVYFGNGVIGKKLVQGNIVTIDYVISSGEASNGANQFAYSSGFRSDVTYTVVSTAAFGGADQESVESIKFNAPRMYQTQNRIVTVDDYANTLKNRFPSIETINVWGGQDNTPPEYGKVFIVAKPVSRDIFLDSEKDEMLSFLRSGKNLPTVEPTIVDPEFLKLQLTCNVYYNRSMLRSSTGELSTSVMSTIMSYADQLNSFGSSFRFSQLSKLIDSTDRSIISNITTLKIRKPVEPIFNIKTKYTIRLENPIYQDKDTGETIWSTRFFIGSENDRCYFKDDGYGNIDLYLENVAGVARFYKTIGTVNYSSGVIEISDLVIRGLYDAELEVMCTPLSNDVIPVRQYLINIPDDLITVNIIADSNVNGVKQQHIFSASR